MTDQNKIELDELLPCPFCGKKPKFVNQPYKNGVCISCKNPKCDVQSSAYHYYNKGAVLFAWNTRTALPSDNGATDDEALVDEIALEILVLIGKKYTGRYIATRILNIIRNRPVKAGDDLVICKICKSKVKGGLKCTAP